MQLCIVNDVHFFQQLKVSPFTENKRCAFPTTVAGFHKIQIKDSSRRRDNGYTNQTSKRFIFYRKVSYICMKTGEMHKPVSRSNQHCRWGLTEPLITGSISPSLPRPPQDEFITFSFFFLSFSLYQRVLNEIVDYYLYMLLILRHSKNNVINCKFSYNVRKVWYYYLLIFFLTCKVNQKEI